MSQPFSHIIRPDAGRSGYAKRLLLGLQVSRHPARHPTDALQYLHRELEYHEKSLDLLTTWLTGRPVFQYLAGSVRAVSIDSAFGFHLI